MPPENSGSAAAPFSNFLTQMDAPENIYTVNQKWIDSKGNLVAKALQTAHPSSLRARRALPCLLELRRELLPPHALVRDLELLHGVALVHGLLDDLDSVRGFVYGLFV